MEDALPRSLFVGISRSLFVGISMCVLPLCHASLIGTTVTGVINFNGGTTNFYDPANGGVPATGYQNSPSNANSPTVTIVGGNEFGNGLAGSPDLDITSFSSTGFIFSDKCQSSSTCSNFSIQLAFTDTAFTGVTELSSQFTGLTYGIVGDEITINIPAFTLASGTTEQATFAVTSTPEPGAFALLLSAIVGYLGVRHLRGSLRRVG